MPPTATVRLDETDHFDRSHLDALAAAHVSPCVSLYLPTGRAGAGAEQAPIRLKNLLGSAEGELRAVGWKQASIDEMLAPARQLLDEPDVWNHQEAGLAIFIAPGTFRTVRAAVAFDELALVSSRFHLRPMLPLVSGDQAFWVLALSQNQVRLFHGGRHVLVPVDTDAVPASLADALAHEDPEPQLQVRTTGPVGFGQAHSHAGGGEQDKAALERFFRVVDRALLDGPLATSRAPLVLAAVAYYGPIYREVSGYRQVAEEVVAGNPDELDAIALHAAAWPAVAPMVDASRRAVLDRFGASAARGLTAVGLEAVGALAEGQIEVLLLAEGEHRWGPGAGARPSELNAERQPGDLDLLDALAILTLAGGGHVVAVEPNELPDAAAVAAILRYP